MVKSLYPPVEEKTFLEKVDDFALSHADIFMPLALIILVLLFVELCFTMVGVSAVESGMMRNFLNGGV